MMDKFRKLPGVLQKQIASRLVLGCVLVVLGTVLLGNALLWLPGFAAGGVLLVNAGKLFLRAVSGDYLCLHGVCRKIEKRRCILIDVEGKRIQIALGKTAKDLADGDKVALYILPETPLYEQDGLYCIFNYIAIEREKD